MAAAIRELFHSLGNIHNLLTVGAGVTKELVEECLKENLSPGIKEKLIKILKNLDSLVKNAQEADKKTREIHERVYKLIDPDSEKVS
jgi:Mg2+ and Co2+ transporter CorA